MNMILLQKNFKGVLKKVVTSHEYENTNRFITFWLSKITLNSNPCLQRTHHTYDMSDMSRAFPEEAGLIKPSPFTVTLVLILIN